MTNTRKTPAATAAAEPETTAATEPAETAEKQLTVVGPPLRPGQKPEQVTLAHHLRIGNEEYRPGQTAIVSPEYARQLRRNGYIARG
ncbi:hypothetical protein HCJ76_44365 [Streptomyces sp. MC1]|uniref:hypothetical protein n=1 Tax=Streptomyces sp. MC1 TaxID=295105 RepID=UPI0018C9E9C2|nr:hypothetical protein [Streptomyces sp. MC1]MBG7704920.1 hypothetical protein [Streptomyces sp. MC1]